jgi:hypothetical protein
MAFARDEVSQLLARCHRRCCICHRFCGVKIETDHMIPEGDGGTDDIGNAIPVCFECHAEIHSYNDKHSRGRKFLPEELRAHKEQWLVTCSERPEILVAASRSHDVGPPLAVREPAVIRTSVPVESALTVFQSVTFVWAARVVARASSPPRRVVIMAAKPITPTHWTQP